MSRRREASDPRRGVARIGDRPARLRAAALMGAWAVASFVACAWAQEPVTFAELAPILDERCVVCHSGDGAPLGLRLDSREGLLTGSDRGPVVQPGSPDESELVRRLRGESQPRMPLTGPPYLSAEEIGRFERWIANLPDGAVGPVDAEDAGEGAEASDPARDPAGDATPSYDPVRAIFARHCVRCHTQGGLMGRAPEGYRLDSYEEVVRADDRARVVPGRPAASELIRRIRGQARPRMPFDGPPYLGEDEIGTVVAWIEAGAPGPDGAPAPSAAGAEVRLHGTWRVDGTLDGLELEVPADARIDDDAEVGGYVEVRGVVEGNGRVRVERLRDR